MLVHVTAANVTAISTQISMLLHLLGHYKRPKVASGSSGVKSQTALVSMISATVAANINIAAGALVPFIALELVGRSRLAGLR
jgi:hypothetical protein